ncbi:MAG: MoaD/ThiS family protein [Verrucomicrobia bacterium]|nr:MoaD/ThiS family protein [Verrucomicrobiota bacterium]
MNTYHIHYFGLLAERRGLTDEATAADAATADEIFGILAARHALGISRAAVRVAVNDELVPWSHPLQDGDRIALLPPMSGG